MLYDTAKFPENMLRGRNAARKFSTFGRTHSSIG